MTTDNTTLAPEAKPAKQETTTILAAINKALNDAFEDDPKVLALGEDLADPEGGGIIGVTRGLSTKFGSDRVRSTPIAEIMLMNFTTVAMDMIVNHAAKLRFMSGGQTHVPIVIRTMTGLGYGSGGQHCDYLEAWFAHTPGIKVVTPSTPQDAYGLLRSAIDDPDPVLFIENLPIYRAPVPGTLPESGYRVPLGKAAVQQEGSDITLVSYARMAGEAREAAKMAQEKGISVEVIDLRTIAPWDRETVLASTRKTGRLLIAHEAVKQFGVGAEIASVVNEELFGQLKKPVKRLGGTFSPVPYSNPLERAYAPDRQRILDALVELAA